MKCEQCEERLDYDYLVLELPDYCGYKELNFCSAECLDEWIENHSRWELCEDD